MSERPPQTEEHPLGRAAFERRVLTETARVNRYGGVLGLIVFSLDNLPAVYERLGMRRADALLQHLTARIAAQVRAYDVVGRWTASEYAILVPQRALMEVTGFAVRLRRFVDEYRVNGSGVLSASFGVTEYRRGEPMEPFVQRAVRAMEQARRAGGNRITAARDE